VCFLLDLSKEAFKTKPTAGMLLAFLGVDIAHHRKQLIATWRLAKFHCFFLACFRVGLGAEFAGAFEPREQLLRESFAIDVFLTTHLFGVLHALVVHAAHHMVLHRGEHLLEHGELAHIAKHIVEGAASKHEPEHHFDVDVASILRHLHTILTTFVVDCALLWICEDLIGLTNAFESKLSLGVVRILVRVPLASHLVVAFLNFALCCCLLDSQQVVVTRIARGKCYLRTAATHAASPARTCTRPAATSEEATIATSAVATFCSRRWDLIFLAQRHELRFLIRETVCHTGLSQSQFQILD